MSGKTVLVVALLVMAIVFEQMTTAEAGGKLPTTIQH